MKIFLIFLNLPPKTNKLLINDMSGIYIHIPFCVSKCAYCNFYSLASKAKTDDYVETLKKEIAVRNNYLNGEVVETIYFGGGTPSILSSNHIGTILETIDKHFNIISNPEITLEANPDTIDKEKILSLKKTGINRVSIGIQSFNDEDLKYLSRRHDSKHALQVIDDLKDAGIEKINLDLIYGIPTLTEKSWNKNLDIFFSTGITHLSAYALTVEPKTILGQKIEKGDLQDVDEDETIRHYKILTERARAHGFEHYEISNFAQEGCMSRHNSIYWKGGKYLGLGASAHSYDGVSRQWNVANLTKYIQLVEVARSQGRKVAESEEIAELYYEREILTTDDRYNEYVMTSLRTSWGCDIEKISKDYGESYSEHFLKNVKKHLSAGIMFKRDDNYILTDEGMLFADGIAAEVFV